MAEKYGIKRFTPFYTKLSREDKKKFNDEQHKLMKEIFESMGGYGE